MYAFIVCRGSVYEKASLLFDVITEGPKKKKKPMLSWAHPKFMKAIKLLFTMAELLPKKYMQLNSSHETI